MAESAARHISCMQVRIASSGPLEMRFQALQNGFRAETGRVLRRLRSSGVGRLGGVALQGQRQRRHPLCPMYPPLSSRIEGPTHRAGSTVAFQAGVRQLRLLTPQLRQSVTQMSEVGQIGEDLVGWAGDRDLLFHPPGTPNAMLQLRSDQARVGLRGGCWTPHAETAWRPASRALPQRQASSPTR